MKKNCAVGLLVAVGALAQTKVDLGNQSRNIDFSQASTVRPFPTGTTLPASCSVGQMYFLTPSGAIEECTAANTWTAIQSGSTGTQSGPISVQWSSTQLTIGPSCSISTPCVFKAGYTLYALLAPATATVTGGSGLAYIYVDGSGNLTVGVSTFGSPAVTCSGCIVLQSIAQYPPTSIPIESWNVTDGAWDATGSDARALLTAPPALIAGSNITLTQTATGVTIAAAAISPEVSGGGTAQSFDPTDQTQWFRDHLSFVSGWSKGEDGWAYSGCAEGNSPSPGISAVSVVAGLWAQAPGSGSTCFLYFPWSGSAYDYWSGSSPATLWVQATYQSTDTNGTQYVGLSDSVSNGPPPDFIGCRQAGAGDWFAVIRAGGLDLAAADTGVAKDNNPHRLVVDNNAGAASTIRCSVDGGAPAVATAGLPAEPNGWWFVAGAYAAGSAGANFSPFQYTIFLQNLPRQ